ncbi:MAG: hypothetical protein AB7V46_21805 [Thermomicrobiales bacterium]
MSGVTRIYPRRLRVPAAWRQLIEDEIERLVAILDRIDGDPDREQDDCDAEPGSDEEPSLGSLSENMDQRRWPAGFNDDREHEHDGHEPSTDCELTTEFHGGSVIAAEHHLSAQGGTHAET